MPTILRLRPRSRSWDARAACIWSPIHCGQGRLYLESDPLRVARVLGEGMTDVTMLRIEELPELPRSHSGGYLSRKPLSAEQRRTLSAQLKLGYDNAKVWEQYRRYYPANVLAASLPQR